MVTRAMNAVESVAAVERERKRRERDSAAGVDITTADIVAI